MVLRIGEEFAGYRIDRELGRGGMGVVYRAVHPRLPSKKVALKVFDPARADPRGLRMFGREAELVCGLSHPNVVRIHDRGVTDDGLCWIDMEYVDGPNAAEVLLDAGAGLDPHRAVRFISDAAAGIDHAHHNKVVHRDIKPSNLLVSTVAGGERVLVADFGIARSLEDDATLTGVGRREYSPHYVAPERFVSSLPDHRCDIYSLGATLHQLLTGSYPYPNRGDRELIHAHRSEPAPVPTRIRPELPEAFDSVIAKAMAKDPDDRFQSCADLATAARAALSDNVVVEVARPAPTVSPPRAMTSEPAVAGTVTGAETIVSRDTTVLDSRVLPRRPWTLAAGLAVLTVALAAGWALAVRAEPDPPATPVPIVGPGPTGTAPIRLTARCYWTLRHFSGDRTYVELPTGHSSRDEPNCILNLGDRTDSVSSVQRAIALCHQIPVDMSGTYDFATKSAIEQLQKTAGAMADGIYGPRTRATVLRWPVFRETDGGFAEICRSLG
ncbi:serine/threonine-protein kinase [Nocardia carnea]|uniref:serine/threonine-protein kinase n=1 Tax=Nocardia carnea TaxID=37328 RepID=UPI002455EE9A|nr:serine/threonine-protein kinase [Nocardia carnea]